MTWELRGLIFCWILNFVGKSNPFLRFLTCLNNRIGPEKGVIHIATGAVVNALWDLFARSRNKPLWKLVVDFTPVSLKVYNKCRHLSNNLKEELSKRLPSDISQML
jgi:L-alanine-DL-glutamate epimerase-like enolase superfamily enzyme